MLGSRILEIFVRNWSDRIEITSPVNNSRLDLRSWKALCEIGQIELRLPVQQTIHARISDPGNFCAKLVRNN